jgi:hypothetical protein
MANGLGICLVGLGGSHSDETFEEVQAAIRIPPQEPSLAFSPARYQVLVSLLTWHARTMRNGVADFDPRVQLLASPFGVQCGLIPD